MKLVARSSTLLICIAIALAIAAPIELILVDSGLGPVIWVVALSLGLVAALLRLLLLLCKLVPSLLLWLWKLLRNKKCLTIIVLCVGLCSIAYFVYSGYFKPEPYITSLGSQDLKDIAPIPVSPTSAVEG